MNVEIPFLGTFVSIFVIGYLQCSTKIMGRLHAFRPTTPLARSNRKKPYLLHRGRQTMTEVAIEAVSGAGKGESEPYKKAPKKVWASSNIYSLYDMDEQMDEDMYK
jgi:hypothetical protein